MSLTIKQKCSELNVGNIVNVRYTERGDKQTKTIYDPSMIISFLNFLEKEKHDYHVIGFCDGIYPGPVMIICENGERTVFDWIECTGLKKEMFSWKN